MFGFLRRKKTETPPAPAPEPRITPPEEAPTAPPAAPSGEPERVEAPTTPSSPDTGPDTGPGAPLRQETAAPLPALVEAEKPRAGLFASLRQSLAKTRRSFTEGLSELFLGRKQIDDDLLEELETRLLLADVGVETTQELIANLTRKVSRKELADADALFSALREDMTARLEKAEVPLTPPRGQGTFVILVAGVNGAGKTTSIGKLAHHFGREGRSVMLAAGDTFRAAAVEQLQTWGERNGVTVVAQDSGADSSAVIFDALQAARARGIDILIADTAGRLHTQSGLMDELRKVKRVMSKLDPDAPQEVLLVLDASIGQNALNQARQFNEALGVTGLILTKLDGTAKGGIVFAITHALGLPIRFLGVGESMADLRPFGARDFVDAMLDVVPDDERP
ncbi:MAG: signal recognition particle-docking protein FtsY [Pseudomonadota bacterium]